MATRPHDRLVVKSITTLVADVGGRVDWLDNSELIAYDRLNADGYFEIWTMRSDGSKQTCLTCGNGSVPRRHKGNPAWHPSGDYIVFQALDDAAEGPLAGTAAYRVYVGPGAGFRNDIWLITADGEQAWRMARSSEDGGVLHPHFSHDGSRVMWAEMTSTRPLTMGSWVMKIADFAVSDGIPSFRNVRTLTPGDFQWYETHSFSPDDRGLLFTAMPVGGTANDFDLYSYDLETGTVTPLTSGRDKTWDEHGHFLPDGEGIVWMSSMDTLDSVPLHQLNVKTEYWLMDGDGQNARRLSGFNDPESAQYRGGRVIASDVSVSSDGMRFVGYLQVDSTVYKPGDIVLVELRREDP